MRLSGAEQDAMPGIRQNSTVYLNVSQKGKRQSVCMHIHSRLEHAVDDINPTLP